MSHPTRRNTLVLGATLPERLRHLLVGWGAVGAVYFSTIYWRRDGSVTVPTVWLDHAIGFSANGVWLYLAFFALVPWAFLRCEASRLRWLSGSFVLSAAVCGTVFVLFPTALPALNMTPAADGITMTLYETLRMVDREQNCLPSLHGALSLLSVWALADRRRPWRTLGLWLLGLAMMHAIIVLRRHLSIDLGAGLLVGLACGLVMQFAFARESAASS